ncbi:MAG TPA: CYTH domain-containing protein [Clostridiales bacterium]|nr:CYTH domain-containing protein [Clostridiales bacterium]
MEIERKYKIIKIPGELSGYQHKKIEQGYLCHNPTVRIRKSNEDYILTYKSKFGIEKKSGSSALINNEVELPLTEEAYQVLRVKTEGRMIYKTRYLIPLQEGLIAELDIFEQQLEGLIFVEVEFPDEKSADEFIIPDWFGEELSQDKRFSNYNLSKLAGLEELGI